MLAGTTPLPKLMLTPVHGIQPSVIQQKYIRYIFWDSTWDSKYYDFVKVCDGTMI